MVVSLFSLFLLNGLTIIISFLFLITLESEQLISFAICFRVQIGLFVFDSNH